MPAPVSADDLLDLVRKSRIVEEKRLAAFLDRQAADGGVPPEPNKLAGHLIQGGLLTHFQAEQLLQGRWKRFSIGRYRVLERLGSGGMGQVFLCEHSMMRRRVAIKVLPTAKAEDPSSLERFHREARAVAALDHPNIVRAYDIDQDDSLHFLVMEYVDGASLQEIIRKHGPMDIHLACHYMHQAAIGLQHAFEAGLVHRDIKPGNVLVDRWGCVKILDMGLARFFHDEEDMITKRYEENVLGTADYLAPEQAIDSHSVDIRADVYSLGVTFYYVLTGSPPFAEGTVTQKLIWHQTKEPRPIRSLRPEVPEGMLAVMAKMTRKDPGERYQTPADVAEAMESLVREAASPPPAEWMPKLCTAAAGRDSSPSMHGAASGGNGSSPSGARVLAAARPSSGVYAATRQTPPGGSTAQAATAKASQTPLSNPPAARPAPPAKPTSKPSWAAPAAAKPAAAPPQADPYRPMWAALAGEASDPSHGAAGPAAVAARPPAPKKGMGWPALALIGLAVAGATAAAAWFLVLSPSESAGPPATVYVSQSGQTDGAVATLAEAVERAGEGTRIIVLDEIDESLTLGPGTPRGLTIEAGTPDGRCAWRANGDALLTVRDVEGLTVKGFDFDGRGRAESAVAARGRCPGLKLQDLTVRDTAGPAVALTDLEADPADPARLTGLDVSPGSSTRSAVTVRSACRSVRVIDCRLHGPFTDAAVVIDGPAEGVRVERNRIWGVGTGVQLRPGGGSRVELTGNTFYAVDGVAVEFAGPAGGAAEVRVERNYFALGGGGAVASARGEVAGLRARGNAASPGTSLVPAGAAYRPPVPAETVAADLKTANPKSADFLTYPAGGPLGKAGPGGTAVGYRK